MGGPGSGNSKGGPGRKKGPHKRTFCVNLTDLCVEVLQKMQNTFALNRSETIEKVIIEREQAKQSEKPERKRDGNNVSNNTKR